MKKILLFLFLLCSSLVSAQEICNNGIDDDGDGKIDLNDSECTCNTAPITSIIPNPSFETFSACPTSFSYPGNDQLSLATPWIQATTATSDYHNTCGYMFPAMIDGNLNAFPNGNGVVGTLFIDDWKEYVGTKLLSPMVAGTAYQMTLNIAAVAVSGMGDLSGDDISVYEPVNLTLFGCTNGLNLPVNTVYSPDIADPTWHEIGHITYTPIQSWGEVTITFTPTFDINAIMIGAPAVLPVTYLTNSGSYPYFIYDNLLLNEASAFGVNIMQSGNFCDNNLVLTANPTTTISPTATYQWYHNGIAIVGATGLTYAVPSFVTNLGQYSVKITDGTTCIVSSKVTINNTISGPSYTSIQPNCITPSGTITITTPALQYSFDNGATWQSSPIKSSLAVGTYFIKIKTPNGCISSATGVTITAPQLLSGSGITTTQPTTCDGTGTITVNSTIASQYSFDDGVTWTTNPVATNLVPGDYLVKIKDAAGCQSASQFTTIYRVLMNPPTYTNTQPDCSGPGSITITTTADFYSFDDGVTWTTNPVASNLAPGYYLIKVKSNNGCESYSQYVYLNNSYWTITPAFTKIEPTCGIGGSITITTPANEYSFDGGDTWVASNTATNLAPGYYTIMVRNNPYCASYTEYVYLNNFYLPDPTYTVIQPSCGIGGSITVTSVNDEYSFDGGFTWTTNPVSSNLTSGTYYVMVRNNLGCQSNYIYVNLDYYNLPDPLYTVVNPSCGTGGSITITTVASEYSFDGGFTWTTNPVKSNLTAGYYTIKIRNAVNCESNFLYVYLVNFEDTYPQYTYTDAGCETYASITITTPADYYSFDNGLTWTTNPVMTGLLGGQGYQVIARIGLNCETQVTTVYINTVYATNPAAHNFYVTACDSLNDGSENMDLTAYSGNLITTPTDYTFTYYNSLAGAQNALPANQITNYTSYNLSNTNHTVYVRVTSMQSCFSVVQLRFSFLDSPRIVMSSAYPLCEFSHVVIDAGTGFSSYHWSTNQYTHAITINQSGNYWVDVAENHGPLVCTSRKDFAIFLSNPATITHIEEIDWTEVDNSIIISVSGLGSYEYSMDGVHYQDSNTFSGLKPGIYKVWVRDKYGCGVVDDEALLLNYPKFFTPNEDGYNDGWRIKFSQFEPDIDIKIFDRYGKLLKDMKSMEAWDGTYNGHLLPSDDYWFYVTRSNGKIRKGHFAMKR